MNAQNEGQFMFRTLIALLLLTSPATAHDIQASDLGIIHPVILKAFPAAQTAAGYMVIANDGDQPDMLISVRVEGVKATLHESRVIGGVANMVHLDAVEILAEDTVVFEQGGLHVMMMGLTPGQFKPGDMVDAVLVFEHQGEVPISFMVEEHSAMAGHEGHMSD